MRSTSWLRITLLAAVLAAWTGRAAGAAESARGDFATPFPSGGELHLRVRSGDVRVVGGDAERLVVRYDGDNAHRRAEVRVSLARTGAGVPVLSIEGGPRKRIEIVVEVPRATDLVVRMPFGALVVEDVIGDKDVELRAGDASIDVGDPSQYGHVDGSVTSGGLSAPAFGVETGGLFRSFTRRGDGPHRVHAHVGAGQLTLQN
jgi:hypothetical protein